MSSNSDFSKLVAKLTSPSTNVKNSIHQNGFLSDENFKAEVSSPIEAPHQSGLQSQNPPDIISPVSSALQTPVNEPTQNLSAFTSSANLLSLLRGGSSSSFSPTSSSKPITSTATADSRHASATDLPASFGCKSSFSAFPLAIPATVAAPATSETDPRGVPAASPRQTSQESLLRLLNTQTRSEATTSSQTSVKPLAKKAVQSSESQQPGTKSNSIPLFSFGASFSNQALPKPSSITSIPSSSLFTATNPFDHFLAPKKLPDKLPPSSYFPSASKPKEQETSNFTQNTTTVSDAVDKLSGKVGSQVQESLALLNINKSPRQTSEGLDPLSLTWNESQAIINPTANNHLNKYSTTSIDRLNTESHNSAASSPIRITTISAEPFTSVNLRFLIEPPLSIPENAMLPRIRFKKEAEKKFDQVDRHLVAATSRFICYALANQGFRVIDFNTLHTFFRSTQERICNVAICSNKGVLDQKSSKPSAILTTGIKGSVFWSPFTEFYGHKDGPCEIDSFMIQPLDLGEDVSSNPQLETRVKASSTHSEFFAYGRGKSIYLMRPFVAAASYLEKRRGPKAFSVLSTQKYLAQESFHISVGESAKDFTFSPDDTVLASIDKLGKLKFWDTSFMLRLDDLNGSSKPTNSTNLKIPLLTLDTLGTHHDKSWPTSVLFFDREKQMLANAACRYVIVGTKQNHNIQFWDLSLGEKVTELNMPHNGEDDGFCSLVFNPKSSLLVVGHPTRNSIYIISISPPKYNLPPMSQAQFISAFASGSTALPSPKATVCMASLREYSVNNVGNLRSLEMAFEIADDRNFIPKEGEDHHAKDLQAIAQENEVYDMDAIQKDGQEKDIEEKYHVMSLVISHSKGILKFNLQREHLGLENDTNKALKEVVPAIIGEQVLFAAFNRKQFLPKASNESPDVDMHDKNLTDPVSGVNTNKRNNTKVKDTNKLQETFLLSQAIPSSLQPSDEPIHGASKPTAKEKAVGTEGRLLRNVEQAMNANFEFFKTYLLAERKAAESAASAKSASRDNALTRQLNQAIPQIIEKNFNVMVTKAVLEKLADFKESITNAFDRSATSSFAASFKTALPREMEKLGSSVASTVAAKLAQDSTFIRSLSASIVGDLKPQIVKEMLKMETQITNSIGTATNKSEQATMGHISKHMAAQEATKSDSLALNELMQTMNNLVGAVGELYNQQGQFKESLTEQLQTVNNQLHGLTQKSNFAPALEPETVEIEALPHSFAAETVTAVSESMKKGDIKTAIIQWAQSTNQAQIFDEVFVSISPEILQGCTPLLVLTVAAATTRSFDTSIQQRLNWLQFALGVIRLNLQDHEAASAIPNVLGVISQNLQVAYENRLFKGELGHLTQFMQQLLEYIKTLRQTRHLQPIV